MKKKLDFLNFIRTALCFAVLLYHLNILKGGFLAVCGFFVVSGFLMASSLDKKDFDYSGYYKKRLTRVYIPLIFVVFTAIEICGILDVIWVSIKQETLSVLGLYNNFYKIAISSDYFAGAKETPFLHLWYVAILLQFQLIYPIIVGIIKRFEKKHHLKFTIYALYIPVLISIAFFFFSFYKKGIGVTYYGSLSRVFSLLIGIAAYYSNKHFHLHIKIKKQISVFYIICAAALILMIVVKADNGFLPFIMLLFSLMIAATMIVTPDLKFSEDSILSHIINWFSDISYEMYLIHYPVIYIFYSSFAKGELSLLNCLLILGITIVLAKLLSVISKLNARSSFCIAVLCYALSLIPATGVVRYIAEKDHLKEMAALEEQINSNLETLAEKQQEYLKKLAENNMEWENKISQYSYDDYEEKRIERLNITAVGDSVMLGGSPWLRDKFSNLYCDAVVSRPGLYIKNILSGLHDQGILGDAVVIHIGANGGLHEEQLNEIIGFLEEHNKPSFWLTVTDNNYPGVFCNDDIRAACKKYSSAHLIDWEVLSANNPEWFIFDKIHLTASGAESYSDFIYTAVHDYYFDIYSKEKNDVLNSYNEEENSKFNFYGNDLLTSCYDNLSRSLDKASFYTNSNISHSDLKEQLSSAIENNSLTRNIVLVLDASSQLSKDNYLEITELLSEKRIYVFSANSEDHAFEIQGLENFNAFDLSDLLKSNAAYMHFDKIHLTEEGAKAVSEYIISILKGL